MRSKPVFAQLEQGSLGAAVKGINIFDLKRARIPVPPRAEQELIAKHLDKAVAKLDSLAAEAVAGIALLAERRAALISAAVTGKIDVRGADLERASNIDRTRLRLLVVAAIAEAVARRPAPVRTRVHKTAYLVQNHARVSELGGSFLAKAAGPLDQNMLDEMERELQHAGHVSIEQPGGRGSGAIYTVIGSRGAFRGELEAALGTRVAAMDKLIDDLAGLSDHSVEGVATLYAVWNDLRLDGVEPADEQIVRGFFDFHPEKRVNFRADELPTLLGWMRRHGVVPRGEGSRIATEPPLL